MIIYNSEPSDSQGANFSQTTSFSQTAGEEGCAKKRKRSAKKITPSNGAFLKSLGLTVNRNHGVGGRGKSGNKKQKLVSEV